MFMLHVFGGMGAGDVKLFAAIGSVIGAHLVLPAFLVVVLTGGLLALVSVIRSGIFTTTMHRVLQILVGLLPGWQMPKFAIPADRKLTIPYGAAITIGAIIATAIFHP
jgi:prepilin peptidase CpaA